MLTENDKTNILASGKLALVDSTLKAIEDQNKGHNSDRLWTNSWNLTSTLDVITHEDTLLDEASVNTLYEKVLDFKFLPD